MESAVRTIKKACAGLNDTKIVVELTTVPIKTGVFLENILGPEFIVLCIPEFLVENTAVDDFSNPSNKVLIGGPNTEKGEWAKNKLLKLYSHWVAQEKIVKTDTCTAELTKLVTNCFLA
mmetsp:Transcript_24122/g.11594  ORF Transcript_24122/g.11594 Transcript_24122/m.11594 type:complete len:119 (+) Transcript_24122:367-723(+)